MPAFGIDEHPLRSRIDAEFLARPPLPLHGATRVLHLAVLRETIESSNGSDAPAGLHHLLACHGWSSQAASAAYRLYQRGSALLRCEFHTEFSSYTIFDGSDAPAGASSGPLDALPPGWRDFVPGKLLVAARIELRPCKDSSPENELATLAREIGQAVVSRVVDGKAWILADFKLNAGSSNFLLLDGGLTPRQAGRTIQRLWEIETYRVMALLGLPVAQAMAHTLRGKEERLATLTDHIALSLSTDEEYTVLDELTGLAGEIEHSLAQTAFRFGASRAYQDIVMQRIGELRESRVEGFPTLREFMERRFMPPMHTCAAMARRQDDLSSRVARISQLLRTRIDLAMKRQNQLVLAQMNRRALQQLRLQETVEGLSVVAITYYASQLVHHVAAGLGNFLPAISPDLIAALAIMPIALITLLTLRRMRRSVRGNMMEGRHAN